MLINTVRRNFEKAVKFRGLEGHEAVLKYLATGAERWRKKPLTSTKVRRWLKGNPSLDHLLRLSAISKLSPKNLVNENFNGIDLRWNLHESLDRTVQRNIRIILAERNVTIKELSEAKGFNRAQVSHWIHHGNMRLTQLEQLARIFDVTPMDLLDFDFDQREVSHG